MGSYTASDHYDYYCKCGHYWYGGGHAFRQYGNPKSHLTKGDQICPSCGSFNTILFYHTSDSNAKIVNNIYYDHKYVSLTPTYYFTMVFSLLILVMGILFGLTTIWYYQILIFILITIPYYLIDKKLQNWERHPSSSTAAIFAVITAFILGFFGWDFYFNYITATFLTFIGLIVVIFSDYSQVMITITSSIATISLITGLLLPEYHVYSLGFGMIFIFISIINAKHSKTEDIVIPLKAIFNE